MRLGALNLELYSVRFGLHYLIHCKLLLEGPNHPLLYFFKTFQSSRGYFFFENNPFKTMSNTLCYFFLFEKKTNAFF